jgi:hypothetical protein
MTQQELRSLLISEGLPAMLWQLPDSHYETVTSAFVVDNWTAWLDARPAELVTSYDVGGGMMRRVPRWIESAGDCDNLAIGTMAWANVGNALASVRRNQTRGGLAYGALFYIASPARPQNFNVSGGHAINWFVAPGPQVLFFEPGRGLQVELNSSERSSAWFGLAV